MKRIIYILLLLQLGTELSSVHAQCPAIGATVYSVAPGAFTNAGNQLQTIDPVTGVGNHVNGPGADLAISTTAIAWDPVNGKIWYSTEQPGGSGSRICSYDLTTNTNTPATEGAGYQFIKNGTVVNPGMVNKAAYNPVDRMIYFHSVTPVFDNQGLYRLNPANTAAGAVYIGKLSVDGAVEGGTFTSTSDIVFDAQGNMTSVLGNSNNLVVFKAQYDASGVYQGVNIAGQSFAGTGITPAAMGFLPDGNYIVAGAGQTGTINSSTGVFTAHSPAGSSSSDYASCAVPTVNISAQKTAIRNCANRTITYTITVQNTGTAHAYDAMLKDAAPSGLTLTGGTMNGITLIGSQLTGLSGSGLPLKTPGSLVNGILMKGYTATVVLNYTYDAASGGASFSNQGFVTYAGVQTLNLPNNQIPTDDPSTATPADATAITQCSANPSTNCPTEIYTVGSLSPPSTFSYKELFVLDPVTFSVVRDYPLPYNGTNGVGTYSIAVPGDGFAYTVGWYNTSAAARTIFKTNLSATPNAAATVSTGIVLPAINGPSTSYYISGTADKEGNIYFSSDKGHALIQVTPTGTVNTIWNGSNAVTIAPTPTPPAGATFTGDFKDITIDAVGDYYFVEDYTKRIWQVPKGTTTAIYRGTADVSNNIASDIIFLNGEMYIVTSGATTSSPGAGPTRIFKINRTTMVGTEVVRPAGQNQIFADAASATCTLISLAPLNGKVLNDNNGQTGGVNGTPVAGATVTLYAANGTTVIATTTTDADGNYHFNNIAPNTSYVLGVTPPTGFSNVSTSDGVLPTAGRIAVITPASGNVASSIDFGVNEPPVAANDGVTGQTPGQPATVPNILSNDSDPNGGTLVPGNISLVTPAGATSVTTDGDGDVTGFTVPNQGTWALNPTTGEVTFTPQSGFTGDPTPIQYTVADAAGLESPPATITVDYNATVPISGTVLNDNDGTTGGVNGAPVAGATVTLYAADGTTVITTTTTDASGNYSFPNLVPGDYVVGITPPGGFSNVSSTDASPTDGKTAVTVGSTAVTGVDFGVNEPPVTANDGVTNQTPGQPATVPNILSNDSDPNGGTLVPGNISLVTPAGATGVTTDGDGDVTGFTVPNQGTWALNPATGEVTFTPQSGFTGDPTPIQYTVADAAGLESPPATITVDYNATVPVSGTVVNDNDGTTGGVNGDPVAGATVTLYAANGTTVITTTTTDASGNYSFPNLAPGDYQVGITPPGGFSNVSSTDASPTDGKTAVTVGSTAVTGVDFGVNQPPVATADAVSNQTPGQPATVPNILGNDSDPNGGTLDPQNISLVPPAGATGIVSSDSDVTGFTVPNEGTWSLDPVTGIVTFTPQSGFTGDPTPIRYTVADAAGLESPTASITIVYTSLPVKLATFEGKATGEGIALTWSTAEEVGFDRFEVEKSVGNITSFITLAAVAGGSTRYAYTDTRIVPGTGYYRLKMVDKDASCTYSNIISVRVGRSAITEKAYPNPVAGRTFRLKKSVKIDAFRLLSLTGKEVHIRKQDRAGVYEFSIEGAPSGVYIFEYTADGQTHRQKVVLD